MDKLVTVITPTYNHAPYLRECMDSVLGQSHRNFEYIIINDGSTDGTAEILASYRDSRPSFLGCQLHGAAKHSHFKLGIRRHEPESMKVVDSNSFE